jgi:gas vesicle protein
VWCVAPEKEGDHDVDEDSKLSYFFLGLGLGVAAGVLFAPKSGAETRDFLMSKANEGADLARRRAEEARDAANDAINRGKANVQRHKDNLSAAVEAGKQAYRDSVNAPAAE